ncbi:hypothetical protein ACFLR1_02880, partial [Bacteroidota bacterium]
AIHGIVLVIESELKLPNWSSNIAGLLQGIGVFIVVCLGWVFFRANSVGDAIFILSKILSFQDYEASQLGLYVVPAVKNTVFAIDVFLSIFFILVLLFTEYLFTKHVKFSEMKYAYRLPIYLVGIWAIFILGAFEKNEFIYFQF